MQHTRGSKQLGFFFSAQPQSMRKTLVCKAGTIKPRVVVPQTRATLYLFFHIPQHSQYVIFLPELLAQQRLHALG